MQAIKCTDSDLPCTKAYGYDACCMKATAVKVPTDDTDSSWENAADAMKLFGLPINKDQTTKFCTHIETDKWAVQVTHS